ncbi:MAG: sugar phosphate nucleotidyltransferase [Candidatus Latescibacteria bacterium]|nr:sugar phosphate nucleotidyltransferase [Candidatus Latescibacterota bacterium]
MIDADNIWAVIPVAGFGTRLRPHTHTRPKPLLHVAGQPIIGHILDQLVPLGVKRVVLVIGYMGELIVDYVQARSDFERVEWVEQKELLGLGHAIAQTKSVVGADPMLMVYGDTVFRADLARELSAKGDGLLGVKKVEDPRRFGVVVTEGKKVVKLVEKPEEFVSDQAIVGVNLIRKSAQLFACLDDLIKRDVRLRGEFQLTDALQLMVEQGANLSTFPVGGWFDCGTQEAMLETNRDLLQDAPAPTHCTNTVVVPPVHIDPTAEVRDSVVGPYVSIGAGASVQHTIVRNAIIGEQAEVKAALIEDSLIGFQAVLKGRWNHLNIGDMSEITT